MSFFFASRTHLVLPATICPRPPPICRPVLTSEFWPVVEQLQQVGQQLLPADQPDQLHSRLALLRRPRLRLLQDSLQQLPGAVKPLQQRTPASDPD